MKRILIPLLVVLVLPLSCGKKEAAPPTYTWETFAMDGSRSGVRHLTARLTQDEAFGRFEADGSFVTPNGVKHNGDEVAAVAKILIDAQSAVGSKKKVIGATEEAMPIEQPQCALSNMYIDVLMARVAALTGKKVDVGITNFGGIRIDLEKGDLMVEDIEAMFPFNNTLIYVPIKGSDLKALLSEIAGRKWEVIGGVKARIKDGKLESCLVGGAPISDNKIYGVASISFLLEKGDNISLRPLAVGGEVIDTHERIDTCMLGYVRSVTASGQKIKYQTDDRIVIE